MAGLSRSGWGRTGSSGISYRVVPYRWLAAEWTLAETAVILTKGSARAPAGRHQFGVSHGDRRCVDSVRGPGAGLAQSGGRGRTSRLPAKPLAVPQRTPNDP